MRRFLNVDFEPGGRLIWREVDLRSPSAERARPPFGSTESMVSRPLFQPMHSLSICYFWWESNRWRILSSFAYDTIIAAARCRPARTSCRASPPCWTSRGVLVEVLHVGMRRSRGRSSIPWRPRRDLTRSSWARASALSGSRSFQRASAKQSRWPSSEMPPRLSSPQRQARERACCGWNSSRNRPADVSAGIWKAAFHWPLNDLYSGQ